MSHIMIDLETMSVEPNAAIVAIGAVVLDFDNNNLGEEFYRRISLESSVLSGGIIDPDTVIWWLKQGRLARREIYSASAAIEKSCASFLGFVERNGGADNVKVWGDGASFDNVILSSTFKRLSMPEPWKYWNDRCYRTVKNMYPDIKSHNAGTEHNALDDAKSQANKLLGIYQGNKGVAL